MRQGGIIAAPGIVALNTMVDRLAEDHARARRLASGITKIEGLSVDLAVVETNMVNVDHQGAEGTTDALLARLAAHGVIASGRPPGHLRMVTHRHHDDEAVDEAVRRIAAAMAG